MIKNIKIVLFLLVIILFVFFLLKKEDILVYVKNSNFILFNNNEMVLNEVWITGRNYELKDNIILALNYKIGDPINSIDLNKVNERVSKLSWVDKSKVSIFPHGIMEIMVKEYMPFAIYKDSENLFLVNLEGVKFLEINKNQYKNFFIVSGKESLISLNNLNDLSDLINNVGLKIVEAIRIDSRRWDLNLSSGLIIKLPANNSVSILKKFINLNYDSLDFTKISFIDLRIQNRMILKYK